MASEKSPECLLFISSKNFSMYLGVAPQFLLQAFPAYLVQCPMAIQNSSLINCGVFFSRQGLIHRRISQVLEIRSSFKHCIKLQSLLFVLVSNFDFEILSIFLKYIIKILFIFIITTANKDISLILDLKFVGRVCRKMHMAWYLFLIQVSHHTKMN